MEKTLIVITGPTAVGKTALSLEIAQHFGIPVISADSRQIYRDLRIGTAAPTEEQLQRVRHFFVGILNLEDYYSASIYEEQVMELLGKLFKTSDYALLTGGSMMYIDAVCNGIDDIPTINDETRTMMKQRLEKEGLDTLREELKILDPDYYMIVDHKNPRRIVHALEICHMTGQTYTSFRTNTRKPRPFSIVKIGINMERERLYERVDQMLADGLMDEVRQLLPKQHLNALNTVGYKELIAYFNNELTLEDAVERIKGNTRRYARKQLTWYKKDPLVKWYRPEDAKTIINDIELGQ